MKPFDLKAALSGAPVVTRDGREVTQLVRFDGATTYSLAGLLDGRIYTFTGVGKYSIGSENDQDLFMREEPEEIWEPTMELRIVLRPPEFGDTLQQKWICGEKSKWADVPTVREE